MDVTFETSKGRRFTIEIWYFDTVREMKERILKYEGIPVASQRLFFQGQELLDDRDTEHYSILQGSHVLLVLPDESPNAAAAAAVKAEEVDASSRTVHVGVSIPAMRRQFVLDIESSETVARLKERIREHAEASALPVGRMALFHGKVEMQDHHVLADHYSTTSEQQMDVSVVMKQQQPSNGGGGGGGGMVAVAGNKKLALVALTQCGTKVPVEVNASDNVSELRKELSRLQGQHNFHLPADGYFFIYKQNVMDEGESFRWHDVKQGDTIEVFKGSVTGGS